MLIYSIIESVASPLVFWFMHKSAHIKLRSFFQYSLSIRLKIVSQQLKVCSANFLHLLRVIPFRPCQPIAIITILLLLTWVWWPLQQRSTFADLLFIYTVISQLIASRDILHMLNFHIFAHCLRSHTFFKLETHRTLYSQNNCFNRICLSANRFCDVLDLFNDTLSSFRRFITSGVI